MALDFQLPGVDTKALEAALDRDGDGDFDFCDAWPIARRVLPVVGLAFGPLGSRAINLVLAMGDGVAERLCAQPATSDTRPKSMSASPPLVPPKAGSSENS